MKSDLIDLTLHVVRKSASGKAVEVYDVLPAEKLWLPLSEIEIDPLKGDLAVVTMPRWLAREKGLIQ